MADSIKIPDQYDDMFKDLCTERKNRKVFETRKDLLLFAAAVGVTHSKKIELMKSSNIEPVKISVFRGEFDIDLINLITLYETKNPLLLDSSHQDDRHKLFEEYANGGLELIFNLVYNKPGDWEDHFIDMILSLNKESTNPLDDITNAWN